MKLPIIVREVNDYEIGQINAFWYYGHTDMEGGVSLLSKTLFNDSGEVIYQIELKAYRRKIVEAENDTCWVLVRDEDIINERQRVQLNYTKERIERIAHFHPG